MRRYDAKMEAAGIADFRFTQFAKSTDDALDTPCGKIKIPHSLSSPWRRWPCLGSRPGDSSLRRNPVLKADFSGQHDASVPARAISFGPGQPTEAKRLQLPGFPCVRRSPAETCRAQLYWPDEPASEGARLEGLRHNSGLGQRRLRGTLLLTSWPYSVARDDGCLGRFVTLGWHIKCGSVIGRTRSYGAAVMPGSLGDMSRWASPIGVFVRG